MDETVGLFVVHGMLLVYIDIDELVYLLFRIWFPMSIYSQR